MTNVRLHIEYDGTDFHGWQRQTGKPTVQALIEDNLTAIAGKRVIVYGASRTDSGVHAQGQVANFFLESRIAPEQWRTASAAPKATGGAAMTLPEVLTLRVSATVRRGCDPR